MNFRPPLATLAAGPISDRHRRGGNMSLRKIGRQPLDPEVHERVGLSAVNMRWCANDASWMSRWARGTRSLVLRAFLITVVLAPGASATQNSVAVPATPVEFI